MPKFELACSGLGRDLYRESHCSEERSKIAD